MTVIIPMAGSDQAFQQHGFPFAKPLIEIDGRPLVEHAWECLRSLDLDQHVFVVRKEDDLRFHLGDMLRLLDPAARVVRADGPTAGAACTALLAIEHIRPEQELVIANGDQVFRLDLRRALDDFRSRGLDAGTIVFDSVHPRWSFVRLGPDGLVVEAAEKRPVSRNATAGFYYFKQGADFLEAAQSMIRKGASVNGAFFVCPTFNELILRQKRIGVFPIQRDQYISLATPQAIEDYEQTLVAAKRKGTDAGS
ncbi:MAG: glycosyltransferase family 2 protein [Planctomycetes bacterium]|nr:glycosyltransferase family 2 protein [Planctomycetota bacterium]